MVCTATDGPKLAIIGHGPVAGQAEACAVSCASVGQAKCMEKKADVKECEAQTSMCVDFCKATLNVGRMLSLVPPTVAL